MSIPPIVVTAARSGWRWQWQRLMGGLGPADEAGNYARPASDHLEADLPDPQLLLKRTGQNRPHLIIGRSCPWAHRTWLVHQLRGLEQQIELVLVDPDPWAGRWVFPQPKLNCSSLLQLYRKAGADTKQRATVPVLLDPGPDGGQPEILSNESAELVQLLNRWPAVGKLDLEPVGERDAIEIWSQQLQAPLNDGVYRCGFARNQQAFDQAEAALYSALEQIEKSLSARGPWLCGQALTLADVRLFPTLIRWEQVYAPLFGCSRQPLWCYPALWQWRMRMLEQPGVMGTCYPAAWRRDYFGALFPLQPSGRVPGGPADATALRQLLRSQIPSTMEK